MAVYEYRGLTGAGADTTGVVDAENLRAARTKLRKQGVFPVQVVEAAGQAAAAASGGRRPSRRLGLPDVAILTRQLATLLAAGLPLMEAMAVLIEQSEKPTMRTVVTEVREAVREGRALADALRQSPRLFSPMYIQMVRAGEASGTLDAVLARLADVLESQVRLRNRVLATMTYPLFMLVIGSLILFAILIFIVPQVVRVFEEMHQVLPLPTRLLIGVSHIVQSYWWLLAGVVVAAAAWLRRVLASEAGRQYADALILRVPLFGRLARLTALARFARTLSVLLKSGIPLLAALDIVKAVMANRVLEQAIETARVGLKEGEGLAPLLKRSGFFPPLLTHMVAVGERSGALEGMLLKVSEVYENEVESTVNSLTALLGPAMILLMGLAVLFIVLAILLPLFEMSQVVR